MAITQEEIQKANKELRRPRAELLATSSLTEIRVLKRKILNLQKIVQGKSSPVQLRFL